MSYLVGYGKKSIFELINIKNVERFSFIFFILPRMMIVNNTN